MTPYPWFGSRSLESAKDGIVSGESPRLDEVVVATVKSDSSVLVARAIRDWIATFAVPISVVPCRNSSQIPPKA